VAWLAELAGEVRPGAVLAPFPLEAHSDHRLAAWITAQALAGLTPAPLVWAYEVASLCPANVVVEMGRLEEAKAAYINLYRSQVAQFDYARVALGLNRYHGRHLGGRGAAEAFFRVPAGEFRALLDRLSPAQLFQEG
jgi:LmbE family N-acetylglucosaminyl deacetylase